MGDPNIKTIKSKQQKKIYTKKIMKFSNFTQISVLFISTHLVSSEINQSGDSENFDILNTTNEIEIFDENLNICESLSCQNPPCQIKCDAAEGFYPDSRNCRDYCQCSGHPKIPSLFNRCPLGTVWDPECGSSGCCNHETLVDRKGS